MNTKFCVCFRVWGRWWRRWRRKMKSMDILSKWWRKMMTEKKIVKRCNHVLLKTMGNFLQTSPMKNDDTVCLYSKNNKIILFCTHTIGYFIYKHHTVGLVLKVNPQLHCCYQTQSIKHTHRKISQDQRCFYHSGKSENMLRHLLQKWLHYQKSLATVF